MRKHYFRIFYENHKHLWLLAYFIIYMIWFHYIETVNTYHVHIIHVWLDDYIPFCEWFVFPYLMWFAFVAWGLCHTAIFNRKEFIRLCAFLYVGMTVFLVASTVYPNGQLLRPLYFTHQNIATKLCAWLYSADTATNLFPSIHVYNSLAIEACVLHCEEFRNKPYVKVISTLLTVSIILSTMFIKQHSVFDVLTAFLLAAVMYRLVYIVGPLPVRSRDTGLAKNLVKHS